LPAPAAEAKPIEPRPAELRIEPKFEPKPEHKVEPILPQAQSIEAQAMTKDVFIAPRPIEAAVRPAPVAQPAPAPDALAAAAMENGGRPPHKVSQRVPSLFERVTKAGRLLHREEPEAPARVAPAPPPAPAPAPVIAPTQPKLGALDPTERPGAKEEDLLDIPAFLRRQAN
jgi:cell division protein FtsZ